MDKIEIKYYDNGIFQHEGNFNGVIQLSYCGYKYFITPNDNQTEKIEEIFDLHNQILQIENIKFISKTDYYPYYLLNNQKIFIFNSNKTIYYCNGYQFDNLKDLEEFTLHCRINNLNL